MSRDLTGRLLHQPRAFKFVAWAILPVAVLVYVLARSAGGPFADLVRVIAFRVPLGFAAFAGILVWRRQPRETFGRFAWGCVALVACSLLAAQVYAGAYRLTHDMAAPGTLSAFDALNLLAAVLLFALFVSMTPLRLSGVIGRARMIAGAAVLFVISYAAIFRWFTEPVAQAFGHTSPEAAAWALYSLVGGAIIVGSIMAIVRHKGVPWTTWQTIAVSTMAAYGVVVFLWPLEYVEMTSSSSSALDIILNVAYMLGYHLFFMASVYWLIEGDRAWSPQMTRSGEVTPAGSLAVTSLALASIPLFTLALYSSPPGSFDRTFYFAALAVITFAAVARTSLNDIETMGLRASSKIDPLTGVFGRKGFEENLAECVLRAEAYSGTLSLAVLDIDDFARYNVINGRDSGDRALGDIAQFLIRELGTARRVARLGGDEFALVLEGSDRATAASEVRSLLRDFGQPRLEEREPLGMSAGVATWPGDGRTPEALLEAADAALYWAKYQGKHRVEMYDERVVRGLDVRERMDAVARKSKTDIVRALAAATDARDSATAYHSRQVAALAYTVADAAGLTPERAEEVRMAALLHDVGKVAVPDSVLRKRSRLSAGERAVLREHADLGSRILEGTEIAYMAPWVRSHHEHWDGSGYPDGLDHDGIPLEARIIAACDVYDRMVSGDAERGPLSRSAALQELDQSMGSTLDPVIAEKLIDIIGKSRSLGWSEAWLT